MGEWNLEKIGTDCSHQVISLTPNHSFLFVAAKTHNPKTTNAQETLLTVRSLWNM